MPKKANKPFATNFLEKFVLKPRKYLNSAKTISGLEKLVFWALIASLIASFWYNFILPKSSFGQIKGNLLKNPQNYQARISLIEYYLENNQFVLAEKELIKLEKDIQPNISPVLNAKINQLWQKKLEDDPMVIKEKMAYWQKITLAYPDYRDGWLNLAFYQLRLGDLPGAEVSLDNLKIVSPNWPLIKLVETESNLTGN